MNAAPNTKAIVSLAAEKSGKARGRVLAALQNLQMRGEPVNFSTVCKEAAVSKTFLYDPKHADLADRIRKLREHPVIPKEPAQIEGKSQTAKDVQLARMKERIAVLERDLRELRKENEILWGRLAEQQGD